MSEQFVRIINDEDGRMANLLQFLKGRKACGSFFLCVASSESSDIEGISAAGASPELRRHTPAIDAEALVLGMPANNFELPVSPMGVVSPVVITRACMPIAQFEITVVDCGTFRAPSLKAAVQTGGKSARCVSTGAAQLVDDVEQLFEAGLAIGKIAAQNSQYVILSECVPAGTTTALGVLTGLGHKCQGMVSSSLSCADHDLRGRLIREGLKKADLDPKMIKREPLKVVAAVGDPMQPFVAGVALAASRQVPVFLGGGSQMLAVYALTQAMRAASKVRFGADKGPGIGVLTTKWVASDASANTPALSKLVAAPFACAWPDFTRSRHEGLRSYELGNVKEGVGAGAAMSAAHLAGGASHHQIVDAIDLCYDQMVLKKAPARS